MVLHLTVDDGAKLDFQVQKMLNAGYTARDRSQVQKHIAKLRKEGIAVPKSFPTFYPQIADRITTTDKIEVLADRRGLDKKTGASFTGYQRVETF